MTVVTTGTLTGAAAADPASLLSNTLEGQISMAGGSCSDNGHTWALARLSRPSIGDGRHGSAGPVVTRLRPETQPVDLAGGRGFRSGFGRPLGPQPQRSRGPTVRPPSWGEPPTLWTPLHMATTGGVIRLWSSASASVGSIPLRLKSFSFARWSLSLRFSTGAPRLGPRCSSSCYCGRAGRGSISSRIAVLYSIVATTTAD